MKMIGIISAMDEEVNRLKEEMTEVTITSKASMHFFKGKLKGKDVIVVRSGIGKANAAICAQILVDDFSVDIMINTGIAGSLNNDINIGDIVLSTDTLQHDMDVVAFGYELGQVPRMDVKEFKANESLVDIAGECCRRACPNISVFKGRILSGDKFVADNETKNRLKELHNGYCTEMEGAAIGHTAYLNGVPFVVIRAISDKADDSAHVDYSEFEKMAIANMTTLMLELVKNIN